MVTLLGVKSDCNFMEVSRRVDKNIILYIALKITKLPIIYTLLLALSFPGKVAGPGNICG